MAPEVSRSTIHRALPFVLFLCRPLSQSIGGMRRRSGLRGVGLDAHVVPGSQPDADAAKHGFVCPGTRLKIAEQITNGFGPIVDGGTAQLGEVKAGVEGVGDGIRRVKIDFASDAGVAGRFGSLEKLAVKGARVALAAGGARGDDAIDVNELVVRIFCEVVAEPEKIYVFVARALIERDQQSVGIVDGGGKKGSAEDLIEFGERKQREFVGVLVVEGEERFGSRVNLADLRL